LIQQVTEQITDRLRNQFGDPVGDPDGDPVGDPVKKIILAIVNDVLSPAVILNKLNLTHRHAFRNNYINPASHQGYIEIAIPEKPNSKNQK